MVALTSIAAGLAIATTAYSVRESAMAKKTAKGQADAEARRIGKATEKAQQERVDIIKKQRHQLGADGDYTTNPTGQTGITEVNAGLLG